MPQVTTVPYVSSFGQIWPNVSLLRIKLEPEELEQQEAQPLEVWLPQKFPPAQKSRVSQAIQARAVYVRSFCAALHTERSEAQSKLRNQAGGIEKCQGAHRPEAVWLEMLYPEFSQVAEYRQKRAARGLAFWDQIREQHVQDCPLASCPFTATRNPSRKRRRLEIESVLIFCRIHFDPKHFIFPPLKTTPVKLFPVNADGPGLERVPQCSCTPACSEVVVISKPYGLPAEPHVSNALHCVQSQYETGVHGLDRQVHPVHRLDSFVGGLMALYLKRPQGAICKAAVSITEKTYRLLTYCPEDVHEDDDVLKKLNAHACISEDDGRLSVKNYMPPSNLFDRSFPLPSSCHPLQGWKGCDTEILSWRALPYNKLNFQQVGKDDVSTKWLQCLRSSLCEVPHGFVEFRVRLHTGRRHQIRSTFSHIGFPIVLDKQYETLSEFSVTQEDIAESHLLHTQEKAAEKALRKVQLAELRRQIDEGSDVAILSESDVLSPPCQSSAARCRLLRLMDEAGGLDTPIGLAAVKMCVQAMGKVYMTEELAPWWDGGTFD